MATPRKTTTTRKTTTARKPDASAVTSAIFSGDTFTYETSAGTITLPSLSDVKMGIVRQNRDSETDLIFALLEDMADDKAIEVVDNLGQVEFAQLTKQWQEDSRISTGELLASLS